MDMKEIYAGFRTLTYEDQASLVAKLISSGVNSGGGRSFLKGVCKDIRTEHRALQADIYRFLIAEMISQIADDYDQQRYDGRNQAYVRLFKGIFDEFFERGSKGDFWIKSPDRLPKDEVGY